MEKKGKLCRHIKHRQRKIPSLISLLLDIMFMGAFKRLTISLLLDITFMGAFQRLTIFHFVMCVERHLMPIYSPLFQSLKSLPLTKQKGHGLSHNIEFV